MGYQKIQYGIGLLLFIQLWSDMLEAKNIKKIYYHKQDQKPAVEPGQLSCYFDEEPTIDEVKKELNSAMSQHIYIIKNAMIKDAKVLESLQEVNNNAKKGDFTITMAHDPHQQQLKITVTYNPEKIAIKSKIFDAITEDKGFMVHFYDRTTLKKLRNYQPPLVQMASTKKPRILVDCGHGGSDTGGIGCDGVQEKDVCLQIGLMVSRLLKEQGMTVLLTRKDDLQIPLPERTARAHPNHADLLVSIHANFVFNSKVQGIETFHLPLRIGTHQGCLTEHERKALHHYQDLLFKQSSYLSESIHNQLLTCTRAFQETVDRRVKPKTSQLLSASHIPTTLVEVGFLSHHHEGRLLAQKQYQYAIAQGIVNGILAYLSRQTIIRA